MRKQFFILLLVIFFGFVGAAISFPIFAPLFFHPQTGNLISTHWSFTARSLFFGFTLAAYPFGQFIGSPILGGLSDQFGRKKLLLVSIFGTSMGYALTGLAIHDNLLWLLVLSRLMTGFLEGSLAIAQASIADMPINKHKGFGALSAMSSLGYVFGPLLGGLFSNNHIVSWFNYSIPFYMASAIALLLTVSIMLWTRETLDKKNINKKSLAAQFNIIDRFTQLAKVRNIKWLLIAGFFLYLSIDTCYEFYPVLFVNRWHMTAYNLALFNIPFAIAISIGSVYLPSILNKKFKVVSSLCAMITIITTIYVCVLLTTHLNFLYIQFAIIGLCYGAASIFHSVLLSDNAEKKSTR